MPRKFNSVRHTKFASAVHCSWIAAAAACGLAIGCDQVLPGPPPSAPTSQPEAGQPAGVPVRVVKPVRKMVLHPIEQPGFNVEAFQETPLFARISGYIQKWNVDIGDNVRANQVLAVLSVPEREVELKQKEAALRQAAAQIEQAKAALLTAEAQLKRSQSQYERMSRLGKNGVLDQESIDETRLGFEAAKANIVKAKADQQAAEAQVEVAKANRDYARTMLQYAEIRAPYDGVVTQRHVNTGDFIETNGSSVKQMPLFVVNQIDPVRVFVNVPGSDAAWIKDGDPVTLLLQGAGGTVLQGKITRNARSLNPQARTLRTEIDLPNPKGTLLPGMYVQARITVQHANVWTVPESAILTEGDSTVCFLVQGGKAARLPVQLGLKGGGLVEILRKRIPGKPNHGEASWAKISGDEVLVAGDLASLSDGQPVRAAGDRP